MGDPISSYVNSLGGGKLHVCRWIPAGEVKGVVQIVHGIAEHVMRYDPLANYLNGLGYAVVAADHMGHGGSVCDETPLGCIKGGWMSMVKDAQRVMKDMMAAFPGLPYILFGHSMGSFVVRSLLIKYPENGAVAAVICGTTWMPKAAVTTAKTLSSTICKVKGDQHPSKLLHSMMFGGYCGRIEHPRTSADWLSRDNRVVDAYVADPKCGFVASAGLINAMMEGILYIQDEDNLRKMNREIPCFFLAGGDDPVCGYGAGVKLAAEHFRSHGMKRVDVQIYPLCRHEVHNEINCREVFVNIGDWIITI